jgi:hypothetical protein
MEFRNFSPSRAWRSHRLDGKRARLDISLDASAWRRKAAVNAAVAAGRAAKKRIEALEEGLIILIIPTCHSCAR